MKENQHHPGKKEGGVGGRQIWTGLHPVSFLVSPFTFACDIREEPTEMDNLPTTLRKSFPSSFPFCKLSLTNISWK